jgi:hypothetical protein
LNACFVHYFIERQLKTPMEKAVLYVQYPNSGPKPSDRQDNEAKNKKNNKEKSYGRNGMKKSIF